MKTVLLLSDGEYRGITCLTVRSHSLDLRSSLNRADNGTSKGKEQCLSSSMPVLQCSLCKS